MSENNDSEQVIDGSTSDENVELTVGSGGVVDGGEVSVSVEPAALNQVDARDVDGGELVTAAESVESDTNDVKVTEDGGREDMFVDCPDEIEGSETQQNVESDDAQDIPLEGLSNGTHDHDLKAEVEHLRKMLNDTVLEKERIAREAEEERAASMSELTRANNLLKDLIDSQSVENKDAVELVDSLQHSEAGVRDLASGASLHEVVADVSHLLKEAMNERVQNESKIRELTDMLHIKNQEIDALTSQVSEFSMSRDVTLSNLNSERENFAHLSEVQLEKENHMTEIANEILASLSSALPEEEFSDDSVMGKMYHIQNKISFLVEKYNIFCSEVDQLRRCLSEVTPDYNMQGEVGVLGAACDILAELRTREVNANQNLNLVSDENGKLMEELNNHKLMVKNLDAEIAKLNTDIEQERTRYTNTKEKLSLAVTKGKALVQQRDALKLSLSEKSSELERCLIELQEKSNTLETAEETKELLLRSENVAASLQEALIQKDTTLKKCEEILSMASGSEFESTDTIEKVQWLVDEMNAFKETSLQLERLTDTLSSFDFPQSIQSNGPDARVAWLLESFFQAKEEAVKLHEQMVTAREVADYEIGLLSASLVVEEQNKSYLQDELEELRHKYAVLVQKENQASMDKDQIISMLLEASKINTHDRELVNQCQSDMTVLIEKSLASIKEESSASFESYEHQLEFFEKIQSILYIRDQELRLHEQMLAEETLDKAELNRLSNQSVMVTQELCALKKEKDSLEKNLEQYEERVASLREKLSMAVKKGKGLVQERERLKGALDEKSAEIEKLKSDLHLQLSASNDHIMQIDKLSAEVDRIPQLEADLAAIKDQRDQLEQFLVESNSMLQKVIESLDGVVLPAGLSFQDPVEKVKWLEGYLSECQTVKIEAEQELGRVKDEASSLANKLLEVQTTIISLKEALSAAENNVSQLLENKKELESSKALVEKELEKAIDEASSKTAEFANICTVRKSLEDALSLAEKNVLVLKNEKEEALLGKDAAESELQKIKEVFSSHTSKLNGADETIQSLEDALVQAQKDISLLTEENSRARIGIDDLENEMKKLKEEADFHNSKLSDASMTIKSLEDALLISENKISDLVNEKKNAEEEVLVLNSKLDTCMLELAGSRGSTETKVLELCTHVTHLQSLLKDEALLASLRQTCEKKLDSLKDMELLLKEISDSFPEIDSGMLQDYPTEDDSSLSTPSVSVINDALNMEVANGEPNAMDSDSISLHLCKMVEGFRLRDKILAENFGCYSEVMDDLMTALFKKLQLVKSRVLPLVELTESLKQKVRDAEVGRQAQENTTQMLERDLEVLLSACTDTTNELALLQNSLSKLGPNFESLERLEETSPSQLRNFGDDAVAHHHLVLGSSESSSAAEKLLSEAKHTRYLTEQFKAATDRMVGTVKDLQVKLEESKNTYEEVLEEKETLQERSFQLETDLEALNNLCNEMRLKLEDYQAKEENIREKEAEVLSLNAKASLNNQDTDDSILSASQMKSLFDKIKGIEMTLMGPEVGDVEAYDSPDVRKLFYIIDSFPRLQIQMSSLSHEKKKLQSSLENQELEIEHLKEEVEDLIRNEEYEKMKKELLEITIGLENIIEKLGSDDLAGVQKVTPVTGLLPVLDKLVVTKVLESENLKSKTEELLAKLHGTQNLVEDLSSKVKSLEGSNQTKVIPAEITQERSIFEAASLPTQSEISEIQDVGSVSTAVATSSVASAAHVRTLRKGSADQLAINIDPESERLLNDEEADEEKGHAFKSLNTSGLIPMQGKMIADRIDGIWVSSGRALMSHPRARLGLIAYTLFLHILLLGAIL